MLHELADRAPEDSFDHIVKQAALVYGFIDVSSARFLSTHQTFFEHDLEEFQDRGVAPRFSLGEFLLQHANSRRSPAPKHL